MSSPAHLSFSQISLFKRCAQQFYWTKEQRVKRRFRKSYTVLGDYIHRLLAAHAKGEDWKQVWEEIQANDLNTILFEEEATSITAIADQAARIVERYIRQVWEPVFEGWEVVAVEQEFNSMLPDGTPITFVPDLLMRDTSGNLWLIDRKTMKDFPKNLETRLMYDDQITLYLYGLRQLGMNPLGAMHDCIRTRLPRAPELTTKGVLSRRPCITDAETVLRAVEEWRASGITISDADVQQYINEMGMSTFFHQVTTDRSDIALDRMALEYLYTHTQIEQSRATGLWPRTFTRACTDCPVRELCMATLVDADTEELLSSTFTRGDDSDEGYLPAEIFDGEGGE